MKTFHRIASVLAAAALAVSLTAVPALAEEGGPASPAPESTAAPAPDSSGSAYLIAQTATDTAGGEISAIERDDRFNLVLRVADYGAYKNYITADQISARVNSSVFTFTGNAEVGQLYEETDPNGAPYYSYVLLFRDVIYNGGGNTLSINLSYLNSTLEMQQLTVTLGQCVDEDPSTPNLMIRESSYGSQAIVAGTPFDLSLTVYATAGEESLNDVVVSLALPDGITMTSGSLTNYIGAMSPKSTRNVVFNLTPSAGFTGGVANITVSLVGTGADTNAAVSVACSVRASAWAPWRPALQLRRRQNPPLPPPPPDPCRNPRSMWRSRKRRSRPSKPRCQSFSRMWASCCTSWSIPRCPSLTTLRTRKPMCRKPAVARFWGWKPPLR